MSGVTFEMFSNVFFKDKSIKNKEITKHISIKKNMLSPKTKETLRKNKSEEDFIKIQLPWIL